MAQKKTKAKSKKSKRSVAPKAFLFTPKRFALLLVFVGTAAVAGELLVQNW